MSLVVPPPPVKAPRRSPRISHRSRLPTPVSSRNGISAPHVQVSTVLVNASTLRTPTRSRVSVPSSRHRAKSLSAAAVPVRAGTKRKRQPTPSDEPDLPRYKLVVAEPHSDEEEQTPRQLRYVKRQRLLVSEPQSSIAVAAAANEKSSPLSCVHNGQENRSYPAPTQCYPVATVHRPEPPAAHPEQDASYEDPEGPVFTPLCRQPIYRRHRTADSTDPTLWKVVCQERVEHLKHVYRDVYRAVVHAEAAAVDAKAAAAVATPAPVFSAEQLSATSAPTTACEGGHTQFELYAPSISIDGDGDTYMETESSSEDDDEDDEDSDDEDMDVDIADVAYERVLILDTPASPISTVPRLPRLSSIRVSSLEPHPPSARDGVSFIGRGTPADPLRLADWAAPPPPLPSRALSSPSWTPEPLFFTPDMVPQVTTAINTITMQPDFGMDTGGLGMSWLDPSLHAESVSPSPSPTPTSYQPGMSCYDNSTDPVSFAFAEATVPHSEVFSSVPITHTTPLSPTGCALHESFLECLRAPGCAGPGLGAPSFFSAASSLPLQPVMPDGERTPALAAVPPPFPNQALTQWVCSRIPSGSVTLGHALG
ncbi:hypothetical protein TRAPUB_4890 [Trametes pubescens]|uniref:Uncharacterized protein n=1 Tax=Trametes pubescens TaxID=154538 RepID=A0A1M2V9Z8_TRAPU|nr:hypothetical protein TRAPUB_4890 [Trametes pubescens]